MSFKGIYKLDQSVTPVKTENNDGKILSFREKLMRFFLYLASLGPFLLSHHPECAKYKGHTIKIGKFGLCIGCFIGYPTAIISMIFIGLLDLNHIIPAEFFLYFGITFLASFILSPVGFTKVKFIKITQKFLIGLGAALIYWWILDLPNSREVNARITFYFLTITVSLLNIYHIYGFYRTCKKCETPYNWEKCNGFKYTKSLLEKHHLINIFEGMDEFSRNILSKRVEKQLKLNPKRSK